MGKFFLLFCSIHLMLTALAQQKDAKSTFQNSRSLEIARSRSVLLDRFLEKDQLAVMLELDRAMMLEDDDYIVLYPVEYWLLSYWLKDYDVILSSCKNLTRDSITQFKEKKIIRIQPPQDYLAPKLIEKLQANRDSLFSQINTAALSAEEKAFLHLNLAYLLPDDGDPAVQQEKLNELADDFLQQYPAGNYERFTREFVRVKYNVSRNGGGYSFYLGKFLFGGNLTDYYKQPTTLGLSFDVVRNNWIYQLSIAINFTKTKTDMPSDNSLWPAQSKALGGYANLSVGKYLIDTKKLALAPIAGIGVFGLDPNTNSENPNEFKGAGIKTNIAGSFGFTGDLKFKPKEANPNSFAGYYYTPKQQAVTSIRFGYEFIASPLKNKYIDYSGTVHKVTVGIGFSTRRLKRAL